MWNRRYMRWQVCGVLLSKERASEGATEEDENIRDINAGALSEYEEIHEEQGVYKQVEM
jgi:hypothetical protein